MIDPDGIQTQSENLPSVIDIRMTEIPECDIECYFIEDDKEYERFVKDIESNVRRSFEYKRMISYLREYMGMDKCAFLKGVTNAEGSYDIKIEIHHYPFTLRDVVDIVIRKREYYRESLTVQMVSKEVMILHYKLLIGLISLSQTVHELAHSSRLFIPVDKVLGRYELFIQYYKPFCEPEQLEVLDRIEKYSYEKENTILDTNIIEQNRVSYQIADQTYMLPNAEAMSAVMIEQMNRIKANNYMLPSVNDVKMLEGPEPKKAECPIIFDASLIKQ